MCHTLELIGLLLTLSAAAKAQELVPFVIPPAVNDKSLIAAAALPAIAVDSKRIGVVDGHFVRDDKPFRVWGVNLCFGANFPRHEDAGPVAARLAAAGVNCVRFHHMDTSAWPSGIWDARRPAELSDEALDRLDYFIDQLARRGIACNVNLHVGRAHSRTLKLTSGPEGYDKMVDLFAPALIDAQKDYARRLLTHVNAYRKVRYADDPAVAFVEITNEDSLFMWGADKTLRSLPPYYSDILQGLYVKWLKGRYGSTAALSAAWGKDAQPLLGADLLGKGDWGLEQHEGCKAAMSGGKDGSPRVEIAKADGTDWHVQLNHPAPAVKAGQYYTLSFRARADKARSIGYCVRMAHDPWRALGLQRQASLTGDWQDFKAGFAADADDDRAQITFVLGGSGTAVEIADVRLRAGGRVGLAEGESLEAGRVALFAESETDRRVLDRGRFLAETEKAFFDGMRQYIKKDLGCGALVTGTIAFGPLGLWAQSDMDYVDAHAYWQHPSFPGRPWDPDNWLVNQKAMVDNPSQATLFGLAADRLAGKPFTVSEYNHPAPNDYQAECVPMIATFAAAQDWDGVWLFAYSHRGDDWNKESFGSFFDIDANPAKWGFVRAGTALFRDGLYPPLPAMRRVAMAGGGDKLDTLVRLHLRHGDRMASAAKDASSLTWHDLLQCRVEVTLDADAGRTDAPPNGISWTTTRDGKGLYRAGPFAWVGRPEAQAADAPGMLRVAAPQFAAVMIAPLDGQADMAKSQRILVAACGRCENTDMAFSRDRRTVGRNWGKPPVMIQPVEGKLVLPAGKWKCVALKGDGTGGPDVPVDQATAGPTITLSPKYATMWYLLTRD